MDVFVHYVEHSHVSTLEIRAAQPYPSYTKSVLDYGAAGINASGYMIDSTAALNQAIADVKAHGGGTVYLPRGRYWV